MKSKVTAVIPTYSNDAGLKLVVGQLAEAKIPVVIVDNRPSGEKRRLAEVSGTVYLSQKKNVGFARAVNVGVKEVKTEWVLIVNDDIVFEGSGKREVVKGKEFFIQNLVTEAEKNKWVAVSPVLVNPDGKIENIGYRVLPIGKAELNFESEKNSSEDLDGLTAACLLFKREVFLEMGGFDESFFAYLEDLDLFLRLKEKRYAFGVATDIKVIHRHQQTSKQFPKMKAYLDIVNWWRVVVKHPKYFLLSPALLHMLVERGKNVSGWIKG